MKLAEIVELFAKFGFHEERIRAALGMGEDPFSAFEGLKALLTMRWGEMNQTESIDKLKELRPIYAQLQRIKLTSVRTQRDVERENEERTNTITENLEDRMRERRRRRLRSFMDKLNKHRASNPTLDSLLSNLEKGERR